MTRCTVTRSLIKGQLMTWCKVEGVDHPVPTEGQMDTLCTVMQVLTEGQRRT